MHIPDDYQAALNAAVYYPQPAAGLLKIGGPDRAAFLQRQMTNDVLRLQDGQVQINILTSPVGRILDVFYLLLYENSQEIWSLSWPERGPFAARYFKSRVFFMDKVTIEDASGQWVQYDILGPQAEQIISQGSGKQDLPAPGQLASFSYGGQAGLVFRHNPQAGLGWRLLLPTEAGAPVEKELQAAGVERLTETSYESLRVEAGLPAAGHELVEEYTPLETNLDQAVSSSKGCYTGQEVLARQITYDKVTRRLTGLRLEAPVQAPAGVRVEGKPAGTVTSAVVSPRLGPIALAIIRRPYLETGMQVEAGDGAVLGKVTSLPFKVT